MELEKIGEKFSGKGPALLTEFESYGARHFLRGLDAETASGLRVHNAPPQATEHGGSVVGVSPDIDEIRLDQLVPYFKLLIIRRTGAASRPPSAYTLVWQGRYYDVWRLTPARIIEHLSLGSRFQPASVPSCKTVMHVARQASKDHGVLATVYRPEDTVIAPDGKIGIPKLIPKLRRG